MSKRIVIEMYSQVKIALMQEVKEHPPLMENLRDIDSKDWGGTIGEIAAYCTVLMDGNYYEAELEKLYEILYFKLKAKRQIIINTVMETKH